MSSKKTVIAIGAVIVILVAAVFLFRQLTGAGGPTMPATLSEKVAYGDIKTGELFTIGQMVNVTEVEGRYLKNPKTGEFTVSTELTKCASCQKQIGAPLCPTAIHTMEDPTAQAAKYAEWKNQQKCPFCGKCPLDVQ